MKVYLVTHGNCEVGYNPSMTQEGFNDIVHIRMSLLGKIPKPLLVCVGTGRRFVQIYKALACALAEVRVVRSPICGSESGSAKIGGVAVEDGIVRNGDYISLTGTPGFNAWEFISGMPEGTLFCSGEELMNALGQIGVHENGRLFQLDTKTKTARKIV